MRHRLAIILPVYLALFTASLLLAHFIRFELQLSERCVTLFLATLPVFLSVKMLACALSGEWNRTFRHATVGDLLLLCGSSAASVAVLFGIRAFAPVVSWEIPGSIVIIDAVVSLLLIGGFRISCRLLWTQRKRHSEKQASEPAYIFGNDESAIGIWKMLDSKRGHLGRYRVVGFVDPSQQCQRSLIGGKPVRSLEDFWAQASRHGIKHLLVPTTTPGKVIRQLLRDSQQTDVTIHKIPTVEEIVDGRFRLAVRELDIDDLLRRPPTQLDQDGITYLVSGKTVLVTGGAGSIGSELCRQIVAFEPSRLVIYDHSEFGVFSMEREFVNKSLGNIEVTYITASVLDADALEDAFDQYKPDVVFHAAAYKHVPLMEDNPYAAIRNNVWGTKAVVDAATRHNVERFVLISTDKAVRPTSVMGATKLLAEKYLQAMAQSSSTKFITVRFGNVLNSVGSVVPTFRQQIEAGGPVTVTHPDMVRYFMTIPEAVQLVLQAGTVGESGDVLILEMGEPVKIVDLAQDMIGLSGLSYPDDIEIKFTGLRPGEKMYEELFYSHEQSAERVHEKIIRGCGHAPSLPEIAVDLQQLQQSLKRHSTLTTETLWRVVNHYVTQDDQAGTDLQPTANRLPIAA